MPAPKTLTRAIATVAWCTAASANTAPCPTVKPITISPGHTQTSLQGAIVRGEPACYSLNAKRGQQTHLTLSSPENNAVFQFYRPGWTLAQNDGELTVEGKAYPNAAEGEDTTNWSGKLAATGKNLIVIGSTHGNTTYNLKLAALPQTNK